VRTLGMQTAFATTHHAAWGCARMQVNDGIVTVTGGNVSAMGGPAASTRASVAGPPRTAPGTRAPPAAAP